MDAPVSFGQWLRQRRKALDLTQMDLAERAGCSKSSLRKIESDERRPSQQLAALLATSLNIPPDDELTFVKVARGVIGVDRLGPASPHLEPSRQVTHRPHLLDYGLPTPPTPLIGREPELEELKQLLDDPACSLLTIIGLPGIGKTRLALEVASLQQPQFADGAHFVSLASLGSPEFIVPGIADAVGLALSSPADAAIQLFNYLHTRTMLLLLDNMEHLLERVGLLSDLLHHAPGVKLLVTSRERLNIQEEWTFALHGLPVPPADGAEGLEGYSSVALFLVRARRARAGFEPDREDERAIIHICRLVEGMPLGIELAAAWVPTLSCTEIAQEIETNLDSLTTTMRDVPERHRSLRAAFDHSWRLLPDDEQIAFRRLSVFQGGFEREAAEHVAGASLPILSALVDKSLVRPSGSGRYQIHTLLRQYARTQLVDAGDDEAVHRRHRDWFLNLAEQAVPDLWGTAEQGLLNQLRLERDNYRVALQWSIDHGEAGEALRVAVALTWFWYVRADFSEGRWWLEKVLEVAKGASPAIQAVAQARAGNFAIMQRDYQRGVALAEEGLRRCYKTGNLWEAGWTLQHLGQAAMQRDEFEEAARFYAESADLFRQIRHEAAVASLLMYQGVAACYQKEYGRAAALLEESLPVLREVGDSVGVAMALRGLGLVAFQQNDFEQAKTCFEEGLASAGGIGARLELVELLEGLAAVACQQGQYQKSCVLLGFSERLRATTSMPLFTAEKADHDHCLSTIHANLQEDTFADAWAQGRAMTAEEIVAYAMGGNSE